MKLDRVRRHAGLTMLVVEEGNAGDARSAQIARASGDGADHASEPGRVRRATLGAPRHHFTFSCVTSSFDSRTAVKARGRQVSPTTPGRRRPVVYFGRGDFEVFELPGVFVPPVIGPVEQ